MSILPKNITDYLSLAKHDLDIDDELISFWECSDYGIFVLLTERFYKTLNYRKADPDDFFIRRGVKELPFTGSYKDSRTYLEPIFSHLQSHNLLPQIFDVGGYIGRFSIECALFLKKFGISTQIHCLEPGLTRNIINANFEINDLSNMISLRSEAASDNNLGATYKYAPDVLISGRICAFPSATLEKNVETIRLDNLLESVNCTNSAIIKIDTEGHEADVLSGLGTFSTSIPHICIVEFWPASLLQTVNGESYADFIHNNYIVLNIRSSLYPAYYTLIENINDFADHFDEIEGNVDLMFISKTVPEVQTLTNCLQLLSNN